MNNFSKKKSFLIFSLVAFLVLALFLLLIIAFRSANKNRNNLSQANIVVDNSIEKEEVIPEVKENEDDVLLEAKEKSGSPEKVLLKVPFTSQAPFGKWDERHEEACEETSLLMVHYFLQKKQLTNELAEKEIQALIDYQIKTTGTYTDSNAAELVKLGADFYQIKNLRVVYDFQKEDLKKYLAKGSPIIIPAAGRLLGNPNFKAPGPLYHNLVLVGYEGDTFITNDPGTRKGEGYRYTSDVIFNAIHDFTGDKNKIENGRRAMIVLD